MAAGRYDDQFAIDDVSILDQVSFDLICDQTDFDANSFHRFPQVPLEASPYEYLARSWHTNVEALHPWADTRTASSPSTTSTPLPPTNLRSDSNDLSRQC